MRIAIGSDHRGLGLKRQVLSLLAELGHPFDDFGCYDEAMVDYPDIARVVAEGVAEGRFDHGILICSTGIGMSIAANKVPGIRAALCYDTLTARRSREHNDANILCLGGENLETGLALEVVKTYLSSNFEGGRHLRGLDKIREMEAL